MMMGFERWCLAVVCIFCKLIIGVGMHIYNPVVDVCMNKIRNTTKVSYI